MRFVSESCKSITLLVNLIWKKKNAWNEMSKHSFDMAHGNSQSGDVFFLFYWIHQDNVSQRLTTWTPGRKGAAYIHLNMFFYVKFHQEKVIRFHFFPLQNDMLFERVNRLLWLAWNRTKRINFWWHILSYKATHISTIVYFWKRKVFFFAK